MDPASRDLSATTSDARDALAPDPSPHLFLEGIGLVAVYTGAASLFAASNAGVFELLPIMAVVAWVFAFVIAAPFLLGTMAATKSHTACLIAIVVGLSALAIQSRQTTLIGPLVGMQVIVVVLASIMAAVVHRFGFRGVANAVVEGKRPSLLLVAALILVGLGVGLAASFTALTGTGPVESLSERQILNALGSPDMQRHHEAGRFLATEQPELLAAAAIDDDPAISFNAIRAIWRFEAMPAIEELKRLAQEGEDDEVRHRAAAALIEIEDELQRKG